MSPIAEATEKKTLKPAVLDDRDIKKLKPKDKPYYVTDGLVRGLAIRVGAADKGGAKSWSIRYRIGRRMRRLTLGDYPTLTLANARKKGLDARKEVANGSDPAQKKQDDRTADTFGDFATTYIEKHAKHHRSVKDMDACLKKDVLPAWKHLLMTDIRRRDVNGLLDVIADRAPIVANRVRALLHRMFNVAMAKDIVEANPVTGTARPGEERQRDRVLSADEIRKFWTAAGKQPTEMAAFWKLRLLTAQRAAEVRDMTWAELDLPSGWWTIPAERSKNGLSHRVPLSAPALTLLTDLRQKEDARLKAQKKPKPRLFVLDGARGKRQQSEAAETFKLKDFRGHDLRRTAASLMTGAGVARLVVSKVLNHVETGVTAVYDRHSYDAEKRIALDTWARTLTAIIEKKENANVVAFARS